MRFTAETAHIAALKSHEPTSARFVRPIIPVPADNEAQEADSFRRVRLARVRKQLDRLDQMMMDEVDPAKLDRIASAQARLSEQERQLSNRSMPPVLRAPQVVAKRRLEPASEPVPAYQAPLACASDTTTGSVPDPAPIPTTPQS